MAPTKTLLLTTLTFLTTLSTAAPTLQPRGTANPAWELAFHASPTCSTTAYQIARGDGPTTGCATVTLADGVTPQAANAVSVSDAGYTVNFYAEPGCKGPIAVEISGNTGDGEDGLGRRFDHCDLKQQGVTGGMAYYEVVKN